MGVNATVTARRVRTSPAPRSHLAVHCAEPRPSAISATPRRTVATYSPCAVSPRPGGRWRRCRRGTPPARSPATAPPEGGRGHGPRCGLGARVVVGLVLGLYLITRLMR